MHALIRQDAVAQDLSRKDSRYAITSPTRTSSTGLQAGRPGAVRAAQLTSALADHHDPRAIDPSTGKGASMSTTGSQPTMLERIKALLRGFGTRGERPKPNTSRPSDHTD